MYRRLVISSAVCAVLLAAGCGHKPKPAQEVCISNEDIGKALDAQPNGPLIHTINPGDTVCILDFRGEVDCFTAQPTPQTHREANGHALPHQTLKPCPLSVIQNYGTMANTTVDGAEVDCPPATPQNPQAPKNGEILECMAPDNEIESVRLDDRGTKCETLNPTWRTPTEKESAWKSNLHHLYHWPDPHWNVETKQWLCPQHFTAVGEWQADGTPDSPNGISCAPVGMYDEENGWYPFAPQIQGNICNSNPEQCSQLYEKANQ